MKRTIGALIVMMIAANAIPTAFASPADEAAIETIVESVGTLADRSNFESLERLFDDEVMVDYASLSGAEAELKSPQALMNEWAATLPGFDRTRHELSNVRAHVDGAQATAAANVVAGHWIGEDYWEVTGRYSYLLSKEDDAWRITSMTFTLEGETGSRDVFGPAMEAAKANPPSYILRQRTKQAVLEFLQGLEAKDMDKVNNVWAEDAVQDMPYVPAEFPSRVVGRDALIAQYAAWPEVAENPNFTDDLIFHPMADPQMVFAEYRGSVDIVPTGRTYEQVYGGLFHVNRAGKITLFREYFDPRLFAEAFGMDASLESQQ